MARPCKQGVDYFPLDVHLDQKFQFIESKFGLEGFAIVIKLLQKIYQEGYWCNWTKDGLLLFAYEIRSEEALVQQVVEECMKRDLFDRGMYERHQILTSKGIQKRYKEIVKRRKEVDIVEDYLLIDDLAAVPNEKINDDIMSASCEQDEYINEQRKVKESKEKSNNNNKQIACQFFGQHIARISPIIAEKISDWEREVSTEVVIRAMEEAVIQEKRSWKYVERILLDWFHKGVKKREDAEHVLREFHQQKSANVSPIRKVADF
ncbi:DUF4373 domain-containing protein [Gracilibacillus oryzae]|uniref:DUF4373 domain-containing protein n=1 Tax=Gracilibacillus oryzae TaxID=1672701 RepID=A0A7C8KQ75_9BACI|nr:Lin1244/Lin1753 domain-containing protein [Gracilibacillus oryzae]KAB8127391.1 DUF4373 domain-containing protein [Gracilibacillus oryzae]